MYYFSDERRSSKRHLRLIKESHRLETLPEKIPMVTLEGGGYRQQQQQLLGDLLGMWRATWVRALNHGPQEVAAAV